MNYFIVLDYSTGRVYRFDSAIETDNHEEIVEKWAAREHVRLNDCEWMSSPNEFEIEYTPDVT